jgi:undecaprenyl diphosphate synthase
MPPVDLSIPLPISREAMPRHVAMIMDGNGRWAKLRGRPRVFGHKHGAERVREIVEQAGKWGVEILTLYAFSDENWKRPSDEVGVIMHLLEHYLRKEREDLNKKNVKFHIIGDLSKLSPKLRSLMEETRDLLAKNTGLTLNVALSYGARAEITRAMTSIAEKVAAGEVKPSEINQAMIAEHLDTSGLPDPDLVIRTSGEQRISNFLLWQAAYSEFYFTPVLWPDFTKLEFAKALEAYESRERRFGMTSAQVVAPPNRAQGLSEGLNQC